MFLLVFGIQEGETYDWGTISGPITVWALIIAGLVVLASSSSGRRGNKKRAAAAARAVPRPQLLAVANLAIAAVGFAVTAHGAAR